MGRLVAVYDASGNAAVYSYDLVGNLLSITNYPGNQPAAFYLNPNNNQSGPTVTIYGTDFCSSPMVSFNGIAATVISATSTQITVAVPSGNTSGQVVVTCGSNSIDVGVYTAPGNLTPSITSFSPASGAPGTPVTIAGSGFQPNSIAVTFNNTPALVVSATASAITAIVPGNATSGPIAVSDSYGQAVTASNFGVLPPGTVYFANLAAGGPPAAVSFDAGSQQALFTFNGTTGEQVLISFDDPQVDCMSSATVNNPDGSTLATVSGPGTLDFSFDYLCYGTPVFLLEVLPATGTYSIFVNDGYDPGSLSVALANVAQLPTIAVGGAAVNVDVPVGQMSALAFQANAGDQVSLSATSPSASYISMVAPDGSILGTATILGGIGEYLNSITFTETGAYVVVSVSDTDSGSDDQFAVQLYSAPPISETIAIGGPSVTLAPVPGQTAQLTFSGNAGQTISPGYVTQDYPPPSVSGTSPDGSPFPYPFGYLFDSYRDSNGNFHYYGLPTALPQTGTYQINFDFEFVGPAQPVVVNLYDATPESGTISIGGPAVAVSTGPGQCDNLSFAGEAGQQIDLGASSSIYGLAGAIVSISNPDGSFLNDLFVGDTADYSGDFSLPQTGTFIAQICGHSWQPGTLNVQLYDDTPVNGSISIDGPSVSMNTNPGQPLELSLSGTAGQQSSLEISGSTYGPVSVSVFNPNGSCLWCGGPFTESPLWVEIPILPVTGTYTIEVVGDGGPGSASLQLFSVVEENLTTSIGGPPVDVTLQVPGQDANITFSANAGQWVSVVPSNLTFAGCVNIELLNPDGSWANSLFACDPSDVMDATQLTQSGTYSIFVDGIGATGSIDIQLNEATPVSGTISIDGAPVQASMSAPSQNFEYSFSGTAGQEAGLSITNFSSYNLNECSPEMTLYDPNGNYIDSIDLYLSEFPDGTATLDNGADVLVSDGTYSIFLDNTGCTSGSAQIDLFTSNTQTGAITFNGATIAASSSVPGQLSQLTISGGAGQSIYLNTSNSTYQDCVFIELIDQSQAELGNYSFVDWLYQCGAGSTGTMGPDTLSSDTYTLLVTPSGEAGSVDLSLSSQ